MILEQEPRKQFKLIYILLAVLFAINLFILSGLCCKKGGAKMDKEIAKWIDNNPQAILESVNKFAIKQQEEAMKQERIKSAENIKKFDKELKDTKYAGVLNPEGTIEIVEFYDYNCGYCKLASRSVNELLEKRKDVKVILRSIPILSDSSRYASQVGTAIIMMDANKYPEYYKTLMEGSARTKESVDEAVKSIGLSNRDVEKFIKKNKEEIEKAIENNLDLARNIGINGTPAFIVNGELIPGAVDANTLESKLSK